MKRQAMRGSQRRRCCVGDWRHKCDGWKREFFETPDTAVPKKKVVIATSLISTGHNITKNVNKVCVCLHVGILCSDEEKQLMARTRPSDVLDPIYICFIEPGRGG